MADLTKELRETLIKEFDDLRGTVNPEDFINFMQWSKNEYVNYMLISTAAFELTLDNIIIHNRADKPLHEVFKNHMGEYAAPQAYLRVALHFLEEVDDRELTIKLIDNADEAAQEGLKAESITDE